LVLRLGLHVSIAGSVDKVVDRAKEKGCNTFQIFTRNPSGWRYKDLSADEINAFIDKVNKYSIKLVFARMPYRDLQHNEHVQLIQEKNSV